MIVNWFLASGALGWAISIIGLALVGALHAAFPTARVWWRTPSGTAVPVTTAINSGGQIRASGFSSMTVQASPP